MFLERIVESSREQARLREREHSMRAVERSAENAPAPRGFARAVALARGGIALIAELKKASPSAGLLRPEFDVPALAASYARGGASALSVLTEKPHFQGELADLGRAEEAGLPRLQKDFILSEYQVLEGRAAGADAVLLIAEAIDPSRAQELAQLALDLGMDVLLEAHEPRQLRRVASLAERHPDRILVGINNRDLRTFEVSLDATRHALQELPHELLIVSESGIRTPEEVRELRDAGARGILVGESLLRAADVERATAGLLSLVMESRPGGGEPLGTGERT